jgi:hypothetical protein
MKRQDHAMSLRINDEDKEILGYLKERLGMGPTQVIRLALRRLFQSEKKLEK